MLTHFLPAFWVKKSALWIVATKAIVITFPHLLVPHQVKAQQFIITTLKRPLKMLFRTMSTTLFRSSSSKDGSSITSLGIIIVEGKIQAEKEEGEGEYPSYPDRKEESPGITQWGALITLY